MDLLRDVSTQGGLTESEPRGVGTSPSLCFTAEASPGQTQWEARALDSTDIIELGQPFMDREQGGGKSVWSRKQSNIWHSALPVFSNFYMPWLSRACFWYQEIFEDIYIYIFYPLISGSMKP